MAKSAKAEDVNGDGRLDLLVHVSTQALGLGAGDSALRLVGKMRDGTEFAGVDRIRVVR